MWGAGARRPPGERKFGAIEGKARDVPESWNLAGLPRFDVNQADVAPLIVRLSKPASVCESALFAKLCEALWRHHLLRWLAVISLTACCGVAILLKSFLAGLAYPMNSVGVLPTAYIDAPLASVSEGLLQNALQIYAQFLRRAELKRDSSLFFKEFRPLREANAMVRKKRKF